MRRYLVHQYWKADNNKVWEGVEYLPKIKEKAEEILKERKKGA